MNKSESEAKDIYIMRHVIPGVFMGLGLAFSAIFSLPIGVIVFLVGISFVCFDKALLHLDSELIPVNIKSRYRR